jgi:hypothetical protein
MLLKQHEVPSSNLDSSAPGYPPIQLTTETWDDDFQTEPNFSAGPETDLTRNEWATFINGNF